MRGDIIILLRANITQTHVYDCNAVIATGCLMSILEPWFRKLLHGIVTQRQLS